VSVSGLIPAGLRRAVVLGIGDYGSGADIALALKALGLDVIVTDKRGAGAFPPGQVGRLQAAGVHLVLGANPEWLMDAQTLVVPAPSIPLRHPYIERAGAVLSDLAILARAARGPLIGVTGSNGKTTTAAWIHHILKQPPAGAILGGNMGIPAGRLVSAARGTPAPIVLEISSFQTEYLALDGIAPRVMVFTNLTPNHLDHYATLDDYRWAKRGIIKFMGAGNAIVLNADDEVWDWRKGFTGRVVAFGRGKDCGAEGVFFDDERVIYRDGRGREGSLGGVGECPLPGEHNLYNLAAAIAAAVAAGADAAGAFRSSLDFAGVEHRLEKVAAVDGVAFYDDSSSTTPESTLVAIKSFNPPPVLIVGGRNKGMAVEQLVDGLARSSGVVLMGEMGRELRGLLKPGTVRSVYVENMADAVKAALDLAKASGSRTVALSPAFASFDMFKNYRHRGQVFKQEVRRLAGLPEKKEVVR